MNHSRRGAALLLTIGYLAIISTFAAVYLSNVHRSFDARRDADRSATARAIAEAGVARAIVQLRNDADATGESELPIGEHHVTYQIDETPDGWTIVSVGTLTSGPLSWSQQLRAEIKRDESIAAWTLKSTR